MVRQPPKEVKESTLSKEQQGKKSWEKQRGVTRKWEELSNSEQKKY